MAITKTILVREATIKTFSKDGREYQVLSLKDSETNEYSGLVDKVLYLPEVGDTVTALIQKIRSNGKEYNSILKFLEVDNTMATIKTTASQPKQSDFQTVKGKLFYSHIKAPDTKGPYAKGDYNIQLSVSTKTKQALEELGVAVYNKGTEMGDFARAKSKYQPEVTDEDGNTLTDIPLIGNGSEATITFSLYKNKAQQGGSYCMGLRKIQLTNLVEYTPPTMEATAITNE